MHAALRTADRLNVGKKRGTRRASGPHRIDLGQSWVAACFAGGRRRFLAPDHPRGGWAVKLTPLEAHRFDDKAAAETAITGFQRRRAGSSFDAGSSWSALEMTLKATFR